MDEAVQSNGTSARVDDEVEMECSIDEKEVS